MALQLYNLLSLLPAERSLKTLRILSLWTASVLFLSKLMMCTVIHFWNLCELPMTLPCTSLHKAYLHAVFKTGPCLFWNQSQNVVGQHPMIHKSLFFCAIISFWSHKNGSYRHTLQMIFTLINFLLWKTFAFEKVRNV